MSITTVEREALGKGFNLDIARKLFSKWKKSWTEEKGKVLIEKLNHLMGQAKSEYQIELIEDLICEIHSYQHKRAKADLNKITTQKKFNKYQYVMKPSDTVTMVINFKEIEGNITKEVEREIIRLALIEFEDNRGKVAKALGISVRTLRNRLNQYNGMGFFYEQSGIRENCPESKGMPQEGPGISN